MDIITSKCISCYFCFVPTPTDIILTGVVRMSTEVEQRSPLANGNSPQSTTETEDAKKPPVKKRVVSGVQPTGNLHLGNYLGAVKQWADGQVKLCKIWVCMRPLTIEYFAFLVRLHDSYLKRGSCATLEHQCIIHLCTIC